MASTSSGCSRIIGLVDRQSRQIAAQSHIRIVNIRDLAFLQQDCRLHLLCPVIGRLAGDAESRVLDPLIEVGQCRFMLPRLLRQLRVIAVQLR
jgi:hypothetical protein